MQLIKNGHPKMEIILFVYKFNGKPRYSQPNLKEIFLEMSFVKKMKDIII